jgi:hypothetical protein
MPRIGRSFPAPLRRTRGPLSSLNFVPRISPRRGSRPRQRLGRARVPTTWLVTPPPAVAAALPTLLVDGAWTTDPLSVAPVWTPIPKCRALKLAGNHRSAALGRFDAGTSEATFSNANRALEPLFAAGPNFPNIRTRKRMRFRAQNATTTYERGHTYVESVKPGYGGQWKDSAVTIHGADAFSLFARLPLRSPYDAAVLAFGARPYYRLNEPAGATVIMDESGSGLNATALGPVVKPAATTAITAPLAPPILDGGTAIQFIATPLDSGGNYLDAGAAPAIVGTGAFSVALWVCWPETVYLDTFYCGQWAGDSIGVGTGWYISSQPSGFDGQIFWVTQDPSATRSVASSGSGINLSDGQWHLILAGRDGAGNLGVWFDAIATGTAAGAASNLVAAPVWVGNVHSQIATYSGVKLWMGKFAMFPGVAPSLAMAQAIYAARTCWDGQSSDARVAALLNYANWPAADRDLDAGVARLTDAGDLASRKLLDALRDTDATEGGCLTVARDNKIMLRNRRAIQGARAASTTSQATFGDRSDLGEIGWSDLKLSFDDVELANHVTITRRNGITAIALDAAAIAASGTPIDHAQVSLSNSDLDATSQAQWLLALLENPNRWRVDSITVPLLGNNTAQQDAVLSREKWERITVAFTPPLGGGARILQDNLIVGIDDDVKAGAHWDVIFHLTATDLQLNPFILGTSLLGSSDVLVF